MNLVPQPRGTSLYRAGAALLAGAGLLVAATPPSASKAASSRGTLLSVYMQSATLHAARKLLVYLPPGYDDPGNAHRRYPVLYLLSGAPGSQKDWFQHGHADRIAGHLIAAGTLQPLILVSPDGNGGAYRDTQFIDSHDGRERVETFITHDLLSYVDTHYRTIPTGGARGLAGYSAGAYGALNIGFHYPNFFAVLAGFCGYYSADPREVTRPEINDPFGHDDAVLRWNSPWRTAAVLPRRGRPAIFLAETTDDGYYTATTRGFDGRLTSLGIPHTARLYQPPARERTSWQHSWRFMSRSFADLLPAIGASLEARS